MVKVASLTQRSSLVVMVCLTLAIPQKTWCQETARIEGKILDVVGNPLAGYQTVWLVVGTDQQFASAPSAPNGAYSVSVPVGGTYRIKHVLTPDGEELKILQPGLVRAEKATTINLDIVMELGVENGGLSGGAIAGIVIGSVAGGVLLLVLGRDSGNAPEFIASPFVF